MRKIYDFKQYDIVAGDSTSLYNPIRRELNGLIWEIEPNRDRHLVDYHEREINLNLLDNVIDDVNYKYTHYTKNTRYYYKEGNLRFTKKSLFVQRLVKLELTFEEACQYIKDRYA